MSARDTYIAAVKTAEVAKIAAFQAATQAHQVSVNNAGVDAGVNPAIGVANGSTLDVAIRNANAAYAAARLSAEMAKQVAIENAKNTLRATGDTGA
jgi:hypothetical protein